MQYYNELPEDARQVLQNRYKEVVSNPVYQEKIEETFQVSN